MNEEFWTKISQLRDAKNHKAECENRIDDLVLKLDWQPIISELNEKGWEIEHVDFCLEAQFNLDMDECSSMYQGASEITLAKNGHKLSFRPNQLRVYLNPRNGITKGLPMASPEDLLALYKELELLSDDSYDKVTITIRCAHHEPDLREWVNRHFHRCWVGMIGEDILICGNYEITMSQNFGE